MVWATLADVEIGVGIDIMYSHHFAHNEEVQSPHKGLQHHYKLSAGSILPGTLAGSVYLDDVHLGIFNHEDPNTDECVINNPSDDILNVRVNCRTANITIVWRERVNRGQSKVVVSYEYRTKD
jgi:hypothetical protein